MHEIDEPDASSLDELKRKTRKLHGDTLHCCLQDPGVSQFLVTDRRTGRTTDAYGTVYYGRAFSCVASRNRLLKSDG